MRDILRRTFRAQRGAPAQRAGEPSRRHHLLGAVHAPAPCHGHSRRTALRLDGLCLAVRSSYHLHHLRGRQRRRERMRRDSNRTSHASVSTTTFVATCWPVSLHRTGATRPPTSHCSPMARASAAARAAPRHAAAQRLFRARHQSKKPSRQPASPPARSCSTDRYTAYVCVCMCVCV